MLKPYRYLETDHCKLHEYILAFFNRIEFETGDFSMDFFVPDFRPIVTRHRTILRARCRTIFEIMREWDQTERTKFCQQLRDSNDIERICSREMHPLKAVEILGNIHDHIIDLFDDLYGQVLDGNHFMPSDRGRMEHFRQFRHHNNEITLCPFCGISELKLEFDDTRDPYDHYLPKSVYPLSSVNFKNLLPICKECNGLEVKADCDILEESAGRRIFYPYSISPYTITLAFSVINDNKNIEEIEWDFSATPSDNAVEEIESWKIIYKIDSRYKGFVKSRIEKWYRHYWSFLHDSDLSIFPLAQTNLFYFKFLEKDEDSQLNFLRRPALESFVNQSVIYKAEMESKHYSRTYQALPS